MPPLSNLLGKATVAYCSLLGDFITCLKLGLSFTWFCCANASSALQAAVHVYEPSSLRHHHTAPHLYDLQLQLIFILIPQPHGPFLRTWCDMVH